jgi:hypothetical protein
VEAGGVLQSLTLSATAAGSVGTATAVGTALVGPGLSAARTASTTSTGTQQQDSSQACSTASPANPHVPDPRSYCSS